MMPKKSADIASRLLAWRKAKKLGRDAGAKELNVSKRNLQNWEQRARSPRFDSIAHVLDRLAHDGF